MLYIGYGHPDDIYFYVDMEFDEEYQSSWLNNELNLRILDEIDNCRVEADGLHDKDNPEIIFSIKEISSGAKALMICNMCEDVKIWGSIFGDNCTEILQEIAEKKDIYIYLQHILRFEDTDFKAFSLTLDREYKDYREYLLEAAREVIHFACEYYDKPD